MNKNEEKIFHIFGTDNLLEVFDKINGVALFPFTFGHSAGKKYKIVLISFPGKMKTEQK